jgi:signal transduction histidine kinase
MRRLVTRFRRLHWAVQDGLLAVVLWFVDLGVFSDLGLQSAESTAPAGLIAGYAALPFVALVFRRKAPLLVFAAFVVHALVATQLPRYQPVMGLLAALFTVGWLCRGRAAWWALLASLAPACVEVWDEAAALPTADRIVTYIGLVFFFGLLNTGAWGTGRWARASQERAVELDQRRQAEAREAVALERARIGRELHDIVAHSVTVMLLQAAGARRAAAPGVPLVDQALIRIEEQGKQAMQELRRMLVILRGNGDDPGDDRPVRQPDLADLRDLVDQMRRAGVQARLEEHGLPSPLSPGVALSAYRVVQEALTNVGKHAGPGVDTVVRLVWSDELRIEIVNAGPAALSAGISVPSTGHGLVGIRERISLTGGRLDLGPTSDGGFRLVATVPLDDRAAAREGDQPARIVG